MTTMNDLAVWKTITIGNFADVKTLKEAIKTKGSEPGGLIGESQEGGAYDEHTIALHLLAMRNFRLVGVPQTLDLVLVKADDLLSAYKGVGEFYPIACEGAKALGLELCPPEVGPELYLQGVDKNVCVGMQSIHADHTMTGRCAFKGTPTMLGVHCADVFNAPIINRQTKMVFVKPHK